MEQHKHEYHVHQHHVHVRKHSVLHVHDPREFLRRLIVSGILTIPVLLLSPSVQGFLGYTVVFPGYLYVLWFLASIIYVYGGKPFITGMYHEIMNRTPGMMTLVGIAITIAYAYSSAVTFYIPGKTFFWELATLIDVMLLGHWIEAKSVLRASRVLEMLVESIPGTAHLVTGDSYRDVHVSMLKPGDKILVKPGERIPVDGVIVHGSTSVDESMITGESKPVYKSVGSEVIAGTINIDGSIVVEVKRAGSETYIARVVELIRSIQASKSRIQDVANRAAKWLTFIALGSGTTAFTVWVLLGFDAIFALERLVTVIVTACPHALGLAIPLVVARSTGIAAKKGILVRSRIAFENAHRVNAVIFDKTGTLTRGELSVVSIKTLGKASLEELLYYASSVEKYSEHPIAKAITEYAIKRGVKPGEAREFKALPGIGVEGIVNGVRVRVVGIGYAREKGLVSEELYRDISSEDVVVTVFLNDVLSGLIALRDTVKPESIEAVNALKSMGIRVVMLTGDNKSVAERVAHEIGIDEYYAEVLPHEKAEIVKKYREKGYVTAMVGDGINDAPALVEADVGIAIGAGTDIAIESADIVLVKSDPRDVVSVIDLSRKTYKKFRQNILWATFYNVFAIPAAAGVLYPLGFLLPPALGALLMSVSTVIVAINTMFLK